MKRERVFERVNQMINSAKNFRLEGCFQLASNHLMQAYGYVTCAYDMDAITYDDYIALNDIIDQAL